MALRIKTIQKGTATITSGNGFVTASITAVVADKTFLQFTYRPTSSEPRKSSIRGFFNSTTEIRFEIQGAAESAGIPIEWQVVEFTAASDITIQEITDVDAGDGDTVAITAVVIADTYLISSWDNNGVIWGGNDFMFPELTSTTEITFRMFTASVDATTIFVIESPDMVTQLVSTLNSTSLTPTTTITAIVENRSFCSGFTKLDADSEDFKNLCSLEFASTTSIKRTRNATRQQDFHTYVVEMPTDWTTDFGTATISGGSTTASITISVTDTAKTFIVPGSGENFPSGNTLVVVGDTGKAFATFDLTSTTNIDLIRAEAGTTEDSVYNAWVVEDAEVVATVHPLYYHRRFHNG